MWWHESVARGWRSGVDDGDKGIETSSEDATVVQDCQRGERSLKAARCKGHLRLYTVRDWDGGVV